MLLGEVNTMTETLTKKDDELVTANSTIDGQNGKIVHLQSAQGKLKTELEECKLAASAAASAASAALGEAQAKEQARAQEHEAVIAVSVDAPNTTCERTHAYARTHAHYYHMSGGRVGGWDLALVAVDLSARARTHTRGVSIIATRLLGGSLSRVLTASGAAHVHV